MQSTPNRIEIPSFPGAKRIAVTTSWDDGVVEDRRVVEKFNEWGIKGTFNLNSGKLGRTGERKAMVRNESANIDASEVASLYAGHEVAIHTVTHPHLANIDPSAAALEVLEDRKALEDLVLFSWGDAGALVPHLDHAGSAGHGDRRACRRIVQRVLDQDVEDAVEIDSRARQRGRRRIWFVERLDVPDNRTPG